MDHRQHIFNLPFDLLTKKQILMRLEQCWSEGAGFEYCVTPNVDHVVRANKNTEYLPLYENAWISVCDSRILQKLARFCGVCFPEVVPGSDLTSELFLGGVQSNDSVLIIGANDELVARLLSRLHLDNVTHYNPPMGFMNNSDEVEKCLALAESKPFKYLFFAVGSPRQEILAYELKSRGKATGIGFCIGASIDFLVGTESRAPKWVQALSFEWFYRFLQNPRRLWRRYFVDGLRIFPIFIKELLERGK
ncbi:WecB/TagA/CpsF family glycosyltransferase [bacterium SCSIO 12696]|nr:WecB/TagA/CpsF family glycosyltransferase [bacterium SCSIO 12696]